MQITLGIPQIIWMVLAITSMVIEIMEHGNPKKGEHNAYVNLIAIALGFSLLYWGGFFNAH